MASSLQFQVEDHPTTRLQPGLYIYMYICNYMYIYIIIYISCKVFTKWDHQVYKSMGNRSLDCKGVPSSRRQSVLP